MSFLSTVTFGLVKDTPQGPQSPAQNTGLLTNGVSSAALNALPLPSRKLNWEELNALSPSTLPPVLDGDSGSQKKTPPYFSLGENSKISFDPQTLAGRITPDLATRLVRSVNGMGDGFTTFTGSDLKIMVELAGLPATGGRTPLKQLIECTTLSVSIHREKAAVRAISYINPKGFARGRRTIAGSLVLTKFSADVMLEFLAANVLADVSKDTVFSKIDQLPPFNITLFFSNENGYASYQRLLGVELLTDGSIYSVNDMLTEQTLTYMASDFTPLLPLTYASLFPTGAKRGNWMEYNKSAEDLFPGVGAVKATPPLVLSPSMKDASPDASTSPVDPQVDSSLDQIFTITQVEDGDTYRVLSDSDGSAATIRPQQFNAREISHPNKAGQPYGDIAKVYVTSFLTNSDGSYCKLKLSNINLTKDKWGRTIGSCQVNPKNDWNSGGWVDLALFVLQNGWADLFSGWASGVDKTSDDPYVMARDSARAMKLGMWAEDFNPSVTNPAPSLVAKTGSIIWNGAKSLAAGTSMFFKRMGDGTSGVDISYPDGTSLLNSPGVQGNMQPPAQAKLSLANNLASTNVVDSQVAQDGTFKVLITKDGTKSITVNWSL